MGAILIVQLVVMGAIFLCSALGNSIVVYIVCKKRRMQSVTNWLILNLALADLTVSVVCIPLEVPLLVNHEKWLYGRVLCPVIFPLQTAAIYGSVLTLVSLSLSRYWAILHPMRQQPTIKQAKILISLVWVLSLLFSVPYMSILKYTDNPPECSESWGKNQSKIYTLAIFVSQYVVPLLIISLTYIRIIIDLKKGIKADLTPLQKVKRKETTRVVKMLVIVTSTFACCILPYHVVYLSIEFGNGQSFPYLDETIAVTYLILYANSACNPIIYNLFNESFRESFLDVISNFLTFFPKRKSKTETSPRNNFALKVSLLKKKRSSTIQTVCFTENSPEKREDSSLDGTNNAIWMETQI